MASNDWFYGLLEVERKAYEVGNTTIPSRVNELSEKRIKLLQEDDGSLSQRSDAQKSVRRRARDILADILRFQGPEVLLLCFPVPISKLAKLKLEGLLKDLNAWWDRVPHPQSLTTAANTLCKEHSLESPIVATQRHPPEESSSPGPQQEVFLELTPANGSPLRGPLPSHGWSQTLDAYHDVTRPESEGNGEAQAWTLPLTAEGAEVILDYIRKDSRRGLRITLPRENGFPFVVIPHQICADILRKYNE